MGAILNLSIFRFFFIFRTMSNCILDKNTIDYLVCKVFWRNVELPDLVENKRTSTLHYGHVLNFMILTQFSSSTRNLKTINGPYLNKWICVFFRLLAYNTIFHFILSLRCISMRYRRKNRAHRAIGRKKVLNSWTRRLRLKTRSTVQEQRKVPNLMRTTSGTKEVSLPIYFPSFNDENGTYRSVAFTWFVVFISTT